jgi:hypothetical protein
MARTLARRVVPGMFGDDTMAMAPHQPFRRRESSRTSYASSFVLAKGEATGFGGSDHQRIRDASFVTSRFRLVGATPRVGKFRLAPSTESLSVSNSPPRRSRPTL